MNSERACTRRRLLALLRRTGGLTREGVARRMSMDIIDAIKLLRSLRKGGKVTRSGWPWVYRVTA